MRARMRVGDFLVAYLQKIGVTHLFGIPATSSSTSSSSSGGRAACGS